VLAAGLACSSLPVGRSSNRVACERYVDHMNALEPCLGLRYDASNLCQEVDETAVDMGGWYECLLAHSACDGDRPRLDVDGCEPPVIDLEALADAG
jgi:hypothetical protein